MTDDVAHEPVNDAALASQTGERARRSRRRGKRSKNKGTEPQAAAEQATVAPGKQPEKAPPAAAPARGGKKPAQTKSGYLSFNDGLDRLVCPECLRFLPKDYPVQHRRGIATVPLREVDRQDAALLLCNGLHSGPCLWPDGTLVEARAPEPDIDAVSPYGRGQERSEDLPESSPAAAGEPDHRAHGRPVPGPAPQVRRLIRSS